MLQPGLVKMFSVAGAGTLEMYTESAVAVPLALGGGYAGENALRRYMETTRFWMNVSAPGALFQPGSAGRAPLVAASEVARRLVPGFAGWLEQRGVNQSERWYALQMAGRKARFEAKF